MNSTNMRPLNSSRQIQPRFKKRKNSEGAIPNSKVRSRLKQIENEYWETTISPNSMLPFKKRYRHFYQKIVKNH